MLITISRQYGAGGSEVARQVAAALGWQVLDNELIEEVARRAGVPAEQVAEKEERAPSFVERLARTLAASTPELLPRPVPGGTLPKLQERDLVRLTESVVEEAAAKGRLVLVGRAAPVVLARERESLHVKLVAPKPFRIQAAAARLGVEPRQASEIVEDSDSSRARYHRQYYGRDWNDPINYHLVLNTGALGLDGATAVIVARARALGWH
jgi:cytidylate kinase